VNGNQTVLNCGRCEDAGEIRLQGADVALT
jgi:hypothetical protein